MWARAPHIRPSPILGTPTTLRTIPPTNFRRNTNKHLFHSQFVTNTQQLCNVGWVKKTANVGPIQGGTRFLTLLTPTFIVYGRIPISFPRQVPLWRTGRPFTRVIPRRPRGGDGG